MSAAEPADFIHSTSKDNLLRILASGSLKSLRHVANDTPDEQISVEHGEKPKKFREAFLNAKAALTPERKAEIIAMKRKLKESWFLSDYRYKRYKKQLAADIGLAQHYF